MPHFRQRGDIWCFTIDLPKASSSDPRRQKLVSKDDSGRPFLTERDARKYALKMEQDIERGKKFDSFTFQSFIDQYFDSQICVNVAESTYEYQRDIVDRYLAPVLGKKKLDKITDHTVDELIAQWLTDGVSKGMIRNIGVVLSKTFRFAQKKRFIVDNPMQLVKIPTYKPPKADIWNAEQVKTFKELAKDSIHYVSYVLALDSGMRLGEIQALLWEDIDFTNRTVTITKTLKWTKKSGLHVKPHPKTANSRRTIELPASTMLLLDEHRNNQRMKGVKIVFDNLGDYYYPTTVSREFPKLCERIGLPVLHYHCMRHTHATLLLLPPKPIPAHMVAHRLGDSVEQVMRTYAHVLPKFQEQAVDKWDEIASIKRLQPV